MPRAPARNVDRAAVDRELLLTLTLRDIKARYKQTILGLYWALINPLATALVFTIVFSVLVRLPGGDVPYPIQVLSGLVAWNFFANSLTSAVNSLVGNANLLTKVYFPRVILPTAAVLARLVDLAISLLILALLLIGYRVPISAAAGLLPLVVVVQLAFTLGVSYLLAAANLFFRDVGQLLNLLLLLWMFMTPVVYPSELVPTRYLPLYMLNPMAGIVDAYRGLLYGGGLHNPAYWLEATIIAAAVAAIGYRLFKRWEPLFAEVV